MVLALARTRLAGECVVRHLDIGSWHALLLDLRGLRGAVVLVPRVGAGFVVALARVSTGA